MWARCGPVKQTSNITIETTKQWHVELCTGKHHSQFLKRTWKLQLNCTSKISYDSGNHMHVFVLCALWHVLGFPRNETQSSPHLHSLRAFRLHFFHSGIERDSLNCFSSNLWEKVLYTEIKALHTLDAYCLHTEISKLEGQSCFSELLPLASKLEEIKLAILI